MNQKLRFFMLALLCAVLNVAWGVEVKDVLTRETTGVTGTSYASWSDVRVTSNAVYAGQSAGGNESIQLRSNNNNSGIITTTSGGKVKSITVTWNSNTAEGRTLNIYGSNTAYTNPTELYSEDTQGTLLGSIVNGESTSLTVEGDYTFIGICSKSGAIYLDQIEITWESASAPAISAPTFSPKGGTYYEPQSVTISCATEGASIYYTTNGAEPTTSSTKYSAPITISATTTIKAISVKGSEKSSVVSAIYTIEELTTLANIAALSSQTENGNYSVTLNNAVVTYVNGNYAYMQDASGAILYYKSGHGLTAGQKLNGTAEATLQIRNSNPQITNLTGYTASDGTAPEPKAVTASAWSTPIATVLSQYLKVTGATITKTDNKFYVQLGSENVQLYGQGDARTISVPDLSATYTIVGFPTMYNTTPELQIFVQPEAEGAVKPAAGLSYGENGTITITYGEAYTLPTLSNPNNLTVTYTSSHEDIATVDEKGTVTPTGKAGQTTIKATFEGNDKYLAGDASYLLVVNVKATPGTDVYELVTDASSLKANDQIIIVSEDNLNALSTTQNTNNRAATDVATESDGTIKPSSLVQVITLEQSQGGWYFNTGNGYLYAPSSSANQLRTQAAADEKALVSTLTIAEGIATVQFNQWVEGARTLLRFNPNNGNPIFNCYGTTSTTGTLVRIYRKIPVGFTLPISSAATDGTSFFATMANIGEGNFSVPEGVKVSTVEVSKKGKIIMNEVGPVIPGSKAYLVEASEAKEYTFAVTTEEPSDVTLGLLEDNMLYPSVKGAQTSIVPYGIGGDSEYTFYKLANGKKANSVGFYYGKEYGEPFESTKENGAFLAVPKDTYDPSASANPGVILINPDDDVDGIQGISTSELKNAEVYTLTGVRVQGNLQKGIYIVNGRKQVIK